jgi:lipid A disaccharide synthetase
LNQVVLTTNSPGELHSWVRGTVKELKRRRPDLRVIVALVPCPYASGAEARVAAGIPGVDQVLRPLQTVRLALGIPDRTSRLEGRGVVVFMGGEPWHALLLARALRWPAVAYAVRAGRLARYFARVGALDPGIEKTLRSQGVVRVQTVGNLVLDGVDLPPDLHPLPHRPALGLFPGSRGLHLRAALAVFLRTAELVRQQVPDLQCLLAVSPFVRREDVIHALEHPLPLGLPTARGSLEGDRLSTDGGLEVEVLWGKPYEVMARMDVALTIPGTNTGEMACVGRPMVVGLSASAPIPRGGLGGVLDMLPILPMLKRSLRHKTYRRLVFVAQPNRLAGRALVPEAVVQRDLEALVRPLVELLEDPEGRRRLGLELQRIMGGGRGASERMAELILEVAPS